MFFSRVCVLTLIRCPFHPRVTQWHVRDPGHSAGSDGGENSHHHHVVPRTVRNVTIACGRFVSVYLGLFLGSRIYLLHVLPLFI